jgi:hypothetical protein
LHRCAVSSVQSAAGLLYHETNEKWEAAVAVFVADLEAGWKPPPLIVERQTGALYDGNHRHEALRRTGLQVVLDDHLRLAND